MFLGVKVLKALDPLGAGLFFRAVRRTDLVRPPVSHRENAPMRFFVVLGIVACLFVTPNWSTADDGEATPRAFIDGSGPGWVALGGDDFVNVNCEEGTWTWEDGMAKCTGRPVGVIRSQKPYTNLELVVEWRHLKEAGNSGVFLWTPMSSLEPLKPGQLPHGIEVQVLDLGYKTRYEENTGKKADWFTCHGDVFPVGSSKMKPFEPTAPNGQRSFPTKELTLGVGEWNHYYIRAINGEVRLWVNGEEVSGERIANRQPVTCAWKARARRSSSETSRFANCPDLRFAYRTHLGHRWASMRAVPSAVSESVEGTVTTSDRSSSVSGSRSRSWSART